MDEKAGKYINHHAGLGSNGYSAQDPKKTSTSNYHIK